MISKIGMQGVASYQSLVTLETDKKVNIVYGLNGTGKSTLSNFLYNPSDTGSVFWLNTPDTSRRDKLFNNRGANHESETQLQAVSARI